MIEDSKLVDILGSWRLEERRLIDIENVKAVQLLLLEPYHAIHPWSRILKGKKYLSYILSLKQYNNNMQTREHYYSKIQKFYQSSN